MGTGGTSKGDVRTKRVFFLQQPYLDKTIVLLTLTLSASPNSEHVDPQFLLRTYPSALPNPSTQHAIVPTQILQAASSSSSIQQLLHNESIVRNIHTIDFRSISSVPPFPRRPRLFPSLDVMTFMQDTGVIHSEHWSSSLLARTY